jgi:hypothetical protein
MELERIQKTLAEDTVKLSGFFRRAGSEVSQELYYEYPRAFEPFICDSANAFAPPLLLVAMTSGEELVIHPPVSRKLREGLEHIQEVFEQWYPEFFKHVQITARQITEDTAAHKGQTASFFSLGVDSFYTLLKPRHEPITHLVYMLGMEQPLNLYQYQQEAAVIERIQHVAQQSKAEVTVGKTNMRVVFSLPYSSFHGAGLAGVAHSLSNGFDTVHIPATHSYHDIFPWGSNPLTDSFWSSENLNVTHDGAEAGRAQKISRSLMHSELALKNLRVCTKNEGGLQNCGKCDKCVRTMTTLDLLGILEQAPTFPPTLPKRLIRKARRYGDNELSFLRENLELAKELNSSRKDVRLLERTLLRGKAQVYSQGYSFFAVEGPCSVGMSGNVTRCGLLINGNVRSTMRGVGVNGNIKPFKAFYEATNKNTPASSLECFGHQKRSARV